MPKGNKGKLAQIIGPALDIRFDSEELPELMNAIEIFNGDQRIVAEVAQHLGDDTVRCVAMSSTEGLVRGMDATDTGRPLPYRWEKPP